MELIAQHICKGQNIGVHGNLFGGVMLGWLDEAGAAFAAQCCNFPGNSPCECDNQRSQGPKHSKVGSFPPLR